MKSNHFSVILEEKFLFWDWKSYRRNSSNFILKQLNFFCEFREQQYSLTCDDFQGYWSRGKIDSLQKKMWRVTFKVSLYNHPFSRVRALNAAALSWGYEKKIGKENLICTYLEQFKTGLTEGRLYVFYVKYCCIILEEFRSKCFKDVDVHTTPKYWHDLTQYSLFWKWHWTNTLWGCRSHNERYQFDHNKGYQFDPIQSSILQKDILLWKKYFVNPPKRSQACI